MTKNTTVNIAMVTYNRLYFTQLAVQAVLELTSHPYLLTVVDNNSQDGTREFLLELKRRQRIHNLFLLEKNLGVAKAANIAWLSAPSCPYYLKLDNDVILQKKNWLGPMVAMIDRVKDAGVAAYNFERARFPLHGRPPFRYQLKKEGNLGGACFLVPERTRNLLGYWCEDYGLYGEEDADYCDRVRCAGLKNIYMEDNQTGIHHPTLDKDFETGVPSEKNEASLTEGEYRNWKENLRKDNISDDRYAKNSIDYKAGKKSLYVRPSFAESYLAAQGTPVDESLFTPKRSWWWRRQRLYARLRGKKFQ